MWLRSAFVDLRNFKRVGARANKRSTVIFAPGVRPARS